MNQWQKGLLDLATQMVTTGGWYHPRDTQPGSVKSGRIAASRASKNARSTVNGYHCMGYYEKKKKKHTYRPPRSTAVILVSITERIRQVSSSAIDHRICLSLYPPAVPSQHVIKVVLLMI